MGNNWGIDLALVICSSWSCKYNKRIRFSLSGTDVYRDISEKNLKKGKLLKHSIELWNNQIVNQRKYKYIKVSNFTTD